MSKDFFEIKYYTIQISLYISKIPHILFDFQIEEKVKLDSRDNK